MSEAKDGPTPGEWYAYRHEHTLPESRKDCYRIDIRGNPVKNQDGKILGSEPICSLYAGFVHFEGNAAAILALPDLLSAAEALWADRNARQDDQDACRRLYLAWRDLGAAIRKAKGGA